MTDHQAILASRTIEPTSIPGIIAMLADQAVGALAIVALVDTGPHFSSIAFVTSAEEGHESAFRHALDMELGYIDAELAFDDPEQPYYGTQEPRIELATAASMIGVDRIVCLLIQSPSGQIQCKRDYQGVEVGLLESCKLQFQRLQESSPFAFYGSGTPQ